MRKKVLILCIGISFMFSSCGKEADSPKPKEDDVISGKDTSSEIVSTSEKPKEYSKVLDEHVILTKETKEFEAEVAEYDLGDMEYRTTSGKAMPFKIRGTMGVPKGKGPFPIILMTHGSHANEEENRRFDTGFTYLVKALAENGYIAVSMDMQSAYLWKYGDNDDKEKSIYMAEKQIECLKEANAGKNDGFGLELTGKVDFSNVGLIGHSRGGDTVFDIASDAQQKGVGVSAILSVAPVMPVDIETKEWPESQVAILVPEYDGDVIGLDGLGIEAVLSEKTKKPVTVTYLRRANHNYFNSELTDNDARLARSEEELKDQITKEEQQSFLAQYAADFFAAAIKGSREGTLYDGLLPVPNQMYGFDVMNRRCFEGEDKLFTTEDRDQLSAEKCTVNQVWDSWYFGKDEVPIDTVTFGNGDYQTRELTQIQWEEKGAVVSVTPKTSDFSGYQALSLSMVTDPAGSFNEGLKNQRFTVVLKDKKGNSSAVTLPENLNALSLTPGILDLTPLEEEDYQFWSHPSPFFEISIPFTEFEGLDEKNVESINICFDQTNRGEVFLEEIKLQ